MKDWIIITGPTASGKTRIATEIAARLDGEIVSADSRQVYRGLDIGTGKDLDEYESRAVPYHMIDIVSPDDPYHIARFQNDAHAAIKDIEDRGKIPVICGGSGLYLESVVQNYRHIHINIDPALRKSLQKYSVLELQEIYARAKPLNYPVDLNNHKRLIRAIEIQQSDTLPDVQPVPNIPIFLMAPSREERRRRITERLDSRLKEGLIEEVRELREKYGEEVLIRLGLEYKYVTMYLAGELTMTEMREQLGTAIHQFAKRQMTWFRRMERNGYNIITVPDQGDAAEYIISRKSNTN